MSLRVRLLFVDDGSYHHEDITLPDGVANGYERLIDCLREEPVVLERLHVDLERLCAAFTVEEEDRG